MTKPRSNPNSAVTAARRRSLISATIEEIAAAGLSGATLSKIAARAGLAAGAINFYFDTKDALMYETLLHLTSELKDNITSAMQDAREDTAPVRLQRLIEANLDTRVVTPEKIATWYYFGADAYNAENIRVAIDETEQMQLEYIYTECEEIIELGGKKDEMDVLAIATSITALIDNIWDRIQHSGNTYTNLEARNMYMAFLGSVFPWSFDLPSNHRNGEGKPSDADRFTIRRADPGDLKKLSQFFLECRLLQDQRYSKEQSRKYLQDNLGKEDSIFFVAMDTSGNIAGYAQLYERWCPQSQAKVWHLSELSVDHDANQTEAEAALLNAIRNDGREKEVRRIDTEIAFDDSDAQKLYQSNGYNRETVYKKYSLILSQDGH